MRAGLRLARHLDGVVIDVGANGGVETAMALKAGRNVVAVECLGAAYADLLRLHGGDSSVTLLHVCASNKTSTMTLHLADDSSSLIKNNIEYGAELEKARRTHNVAHGNRETVVTARLDDLISVTTKVALIKIDVQGFESHVIAGASRIVTRNLPVLVYEDNGNFDASGAIRLPRGYTCKRVNGDNVCHAR